MAQAQHRSRTANTARKLAAMVIATGCLMIGFMAIWTPFPIGAILIALGLALLVANSRRASRILRRMRRRIPVLDRSFQWLEDRLAGRTGRLLKQTRPRAASEGNRPARRSNGAR